eukprot:1560195-Amphidinium_carterae.1
MYRCNRQHGVNRDCAAIQCHRGDSKRKRAWHYAVPSDQRCFHQNETTATHVRAEMLSNFRSYMFFATPLAFVIAKAFPISQRYPKSCKIQQLQLFFVLSVYIAARTFRWAG